MIILIDNGHGVNTPGKCSPDKTVLEWKETRTIAKLLNDKLKSLGYTSYLLVTEDTDISLKERAKRANEYCKKYGSKNVVLVSIHLNAAGDDGKWHDATGFSSHVSNNASTKSKQLAKLLWDEAIKQGLKGNRYVPKEGYHAQNLAICRDTNCPAVLTENLFQDNKEDCKIIISQEGKYKIVQAHVDAIQKYIKEYA